MKKFLNMKTSKSRPAASSCALRQMDVEVKFTNGTTEYFTGEAVQCGGKVMINSKKEFVIIPLENILYCRMRETEEENE